MTELKNTNQIDSTRVEPEDEIDLIALAKVLWEDRRAVIRTVIIFMTLGLFIAIFSPKEYTASTTMVPQSAEGGSRISGSLGGLAAMAGINLGGLGGGSDVSPTLYPKILNSIPFQKELMKTKLSIEGQSDELTFAIYHLEFKKPSLFDYVKKYTIGLPSVIIKGITNAFKGNKSKNTDARLTSSSNEILSVSLEEKILRNLLKSQLSLEVNEKDGYVSLSARMPEAKAAAQLAKNAQELLQQAITNFKIQKANDQLNFVENRYNEKQKEFEAIQYKLAQFRDRNKNVSSAMAQTDLERLQAEYNLIYGVYSELAKQLEMQKIQVKEDTPVFTIIEPVSIPRDKSKPKFLKIFVIWTFLGGIFGVGMTFGKEFFRSIKNKWNKED